MMGRIQAAILDLDGLMIDSEPLQLQAMNKALACVGIALTEAEWMRFVGQKSIETIRQLKALHHFDRDPAEIEAAKLYAYRQLIQENDVLKLMPGLREAIRACRALQLKLGLASSSIQADISIILNKFDLSSTFDAVVSGDQVAVGKPDPAIFLEAARRLAVNPGNCLVLEDSPGGVTAANTAGMFSVAVPNRFTAQQDFDLANATLKDLFEFARDLPRLAL
jgi:HAD superfamily hydrolase (TIGR01509 family)